MLLLSDNKMVSEFRHKMGVPINLATGLHNADYNKAQREI